LKGRIRQPENNESFLKEFFQERYANFMQIWFNIKFDAFETVKIAIVFNNFD
jgi:hypothetical protein